MRRKNGEPNVSGDGHIKFRVIEFEIDGDNGTLAEGIRALTTALSKTSGPTALVQPPRPALPPAAPKGTATTTEPAAPVEGELFPETETTEQERVENTNGNATPTRAKRGTGAPPPTPEVLSDIDLNAGKVSLKDYMAQKNPPDTYERFVTIAVWYKENHDLGEVNADRVYTAYRFLDIPSPNDVGQTLRNIKAGKKWFDKGDQKGGYKVNILGLNKVHNNFQ